MVVRCWKVLNVRDGESISVTWCPTLDTVFCAMNAVLRNVGQRLCGWLIMRPHILAAPEFAEVLRSVHVHIL